MGRGIKKNLRLSLSIAISIIALLSLVVIAGCYDGMLDDIQQKIEEDRIEAGTAPTYSVTYDGNGSDGGTVPVDSNAYVEGGTVIAASAGTMTRTGGYTFIGWNTASDGSGTARAANDFFTMGASNVTLYAQWTDLDTYTVDYNGNDSDGGTVPVDSNAYVEGAMVTVKGNTGDLVRTDYNFGGWNRRADGTGANYTPAETFNIGSADVTLYAKWTIKPYTVTYSGNDETGGTVPDTHYYNQGDTVMIQGNTGSLVKIQDGISLLLTGWNTQADGNGTDYALGTGSFTMGTLDITLYAKWTALRCTGPASGWIFYDKGFYSEGWRYLEAAPSDQSTAFQWWNGSYKATGATGTVLGTGSVNTGTIVTSQGDGSYAAQLCNNLTIGSYSDWFLPSKDELNQMYINLDSQGVGGLDVSVYWSSSESGTNYAWVQRYNDNGGQSYGLKYVTYGVRAARAF